MLCNRFQFLLCHFFCGVCELHTVCCGFCVVGAPSLMVFPFLGTRVDRPTRVSNASAVGGMLFCACCVPHAVGALLAGMIVLKWWCHNPWQRAYYLASVFARFHRSGPAFSPGPVVRRALLMAILRHPGIMLLTKEDGRCPSGESGGECAVFTPKRAQSAFFAALRRVAII